LETIEKHINAKKLHLIFELEKFSNQNQQDFTAEILSSLSLNENIEEITFSKCFYFTPYSIKSLLTSSKISTIKLKSKNEGKIYEDLLTELITNTTIKKLVLKDCLFLRDSNAVKLVEIINQNKTLEELEMYDFRISTEIIENIGLGLVNNNNRLKKLSLVSYDYGYNQRIENILVKRVGVLTKNTEVTLKFAI
jgi:hypothetical protein